MAKAKATARTTPKKTKVRKPAIVIDKALKAQWAIELGRLQQARADETAGWDEKFEAVGRILELEPPLYLAGGFKTAREFLAAELPGIDERSVYTYVRVAQSFAAEDEAKYGISKLDKLLDYIEAVGATPMPPAKIHPERQTIKLRHGKRLRTIAFADATVADLVAAIRGHRAAKGKAAKTQPPLVKAIRQALRTKKGLGSVGVSLRRDVVTLSAPAATLAAVCAVVAKVKLPVP